MQVEGARLVTNQLRFYSTNGAPWDSRNYFLNGTAGDSHGMNVQTPANKIRRLVVFQAVSPDDAVLTKLRFQVIDPDGNVALTLADQATARWIVGQASGMPCSNDGSGASGVDPQTLEVWLPPHYYPLLSVVANLSVGGGADSFAGVYSAWEWDLDQEGRPIWRR